MRPLSGTGQASRRRGRRAHTRAHASNVWRCLRASAREPEQTAEHGGRRRRGTTRQRVDHDTRTSAQTKRSARSTLSIDLVIRGASGCAPRLDLALGCLAVTPHTLVCRMRGSSTFFRWLCAASSSLPCQVDVDTRHVCGARVARCASSARVSGFFDCLSAAPWFRSARAPSMTSSPCKAPT